MKFIKGAGKLRLILGTQTFWGPLNFSFSNSLFPALMQPKGLSWSPPSQFGRCHPMCHPMGPQAHEACPRAGNLSSPPRPGSGKQETKHNHISTMDTAGERAPGRVLRRGWGGGCGGASGPKVCVPKMAQIHKPPPPPPNKVPPPNSVPPLIVYPPWLNKRFAKYCTPFSSHTSKRNTNRFRIRSQHHNTVAHLKKVVIVVCFFTLETLLEALSVSCTPSASGISAPSPPSVSSLPVSTSSSVAGSSEGTSEGGSEKPSSTLSTA